MPVYQRHYAWDTGDNGQITRLWEDIEEKAKEFLAGGVAYPHYIGAIIVAEPLNQPFGTVRQRLIVDGQQRITAFQLVLTAIREVARQNEFENLLPVINSYLFNEISGGMSKPEVEKYKLWPSSFDRKLYHDVVNNPASDIPGIYSKYFHKNGNLKWGSAARLLTSYWYLIKQIIAFVNDDDNGEMEPSRRLSAILGGFLSGFRVVVIQLDDKDDAQEIFASLNGLGKPLTPIDLIRNDIFYRAKQANEDDEALFEGHWKIFEEPFWESMARQGRFKKPRIDFFLGHVLVAETCREVNLGKLAAEYQNYARGRKLPSVAAEIEQIIKYVETYRTLVGSSATPFVEQIATFLRIWDLTTFYPLILFVAVQEIPEEEKVRIFDLIKTYIVRRDLCGLTAKNYNNIVLRCLQHLRNSGPSLFNLFEFLKGIEGDAGRLPPDMEVIKSFSQRKIYSVLPTPRLLFVLAAIEQHKRTSFDESVLATSPLTIEHVMPQKWAQNGHFRTEVLHRTSRLFWP